MDFLKDIFGDKPLSYNDFVKAVEESGKKLVDLSTGEYVKLEKHKRIENELADAKKAKKVLEEELNAIKGENMTSEQKLQAAIEAAEAEKKRFAVELNKLEAEKIFSKAGLTENDYADFIDSFISADKDSTIQKARSFAELYTKKLADKEAAVKAELMKNTPPPNGGLGVGSGSQNEKNIGQAIAEKQASVVKGVEEARNKYFEN